MQFSSSSSCSYYYYYFNFTKGIAVNHSFVSFFSLSPQGSENKGSFLIKGSLTQSDFIARQLRAAIKSQQSCTKFRASSHLRRQGCDLSQLNRRLFTRAICCRREIAARSQLLSRDKIALRKRPLNEPLGSYSTVLYVAQRRNSLIQK